MNSYSRSILLICLLGVTAMPSGLDEMDVVEDENPLTMRDRTSNCEQFTELSLEKSNPAYCKVFEACCNLNFDPLNGDRCQDKEVRCDVDTAFCIWRNCTELITTTTTTTLAPTTTQSASSVGLVLTTLGAMFLLH